MLSYKYIASVQLAFSRESIGPSNRCCVFLHGVLSCCAYIFEACQSSFSSHAALIYSTVGRNQHAEKHSDEVTIVNNGLFACTC